MASMPSAVHDILGEEASEELARWIDQRIHERGVSRDEYREVLSRLDLIERDLEGVKTELRGLRRETNERFDRMSAQFNDRLDRMSAQFDERFDRMNAQSDERFDRMSAQSDERFDRMSAQFDNRFDHLNSDFGSRLDRMEERMVSTTRWTVGTIALFGTIITILLAISQLSP